MITTIIAKVDNFIYKSFRIVTPLRRAIWHQSSIEIQKELAYQHGIRDFLNRHGYDVTTEEALRIYEEL